MRSEEASLPKLVHVTYLVRVICVHGGADRECYGCLCRKCLEYLRFAEHILITSVWR
jgi:hypothetical protein